MINQTKKMLSALLVGILLLSGCNNTITDETDTTETILETEVSTEVPELTPAKHEISVEEVESLLIANGLQTNIHSKSPYPAVHSGQQMRVVHTERGTYTAFCRDFGHETGIGQFIVAKIDNDNNVTLLYFGEHRAEGSVPVNIAQNTNGDIIVMAAAAHIPGQKYETTTPDLAIYIFDAETDAMTSYTANMVVGDSAGEGECLVSGESWLGYSEAYFDFENQKIYAFFDGGDFTSDFLLEWFTFDLVTKQWATTSTYKWFEGIGRHGYFFIFPDENGGVYIVANQNAPIQVTDGLLNYLGSPGSHEKYSNYEYVFGTITLFHIPDLTSSENITYTPVQEPYSERGQEGIWSDMQCITYGGAFMDADGYLHITYRYFLTDFLSDKPGLYVLDNPKYDPDLQYRHAIFDGMECIYNEKMDIEDTDWQYLKPQITQSTDGTLYMIVNKDQSRPIQVKVYKAEDALGKTWTLESVNTLDEEKYLRNFSISQARNGSTQDNTVSCFTYGMYGGYDVLEDKRINIQKAYNIRFWNYRYKKRKYIFLKKLLTFCVMSCILYK